MEKCEFHTFSFCGLRVRRAALSAGAARAHTIAKAKLRKNSPNGEIGASESCRAALCGPAGPRLRQVGLTCVSFFSRCFRAAAWRDTLAKLRTSAAGRLRPARLRGVADTLRSAVRAVRAGLRRAHASPRLCRNWRRGGGKSVPCTIFAPATAKNITMMKKMLLFLLLAGCTAAAGAQVRFEKLTMTEACAEARRSGKLLFVDLYASWCPPCRMMDKQVFPRHDVGALPCGALRVREVRHRSARGAGAGQALRRGGGAHLSDMYGRRRAAGTHCGGCRCAAVHERRCGLCSAGTARLPEGRTLRRRDLRRGRPTHRTPHPAAVVRRCRSGKGFRAPPLRRAGCRPPFRFEKLLVEEARDVVEGPPASRRGQLLGQVAALEVEDAVRQRAVPPLFEELHTQPTKAGMAVTARDTT